MHDETRELTDKHEVDNGQNKGRGSYEQQQVRCVPMGVKVRYVRGPSEYVWPHTG